MLLIINDSCSCKLKMGCGKGLNITGEILTLWTLIHFVYTKKITFMHVYGDSKVITYQLNGSGRLQVSMLNNQKMKIKDLIPSLSHLELHHIYREFNAKVDNLSKQALLYDEGRIYCKEFVDGVVTSYSYMIVF